MSIVLKKNVVSCLASGLWPAVESQMLSLSEKEKGDMFEVVTSALIRLRDPRLEVLSTSLDKGELSSRGLVSVDDGIDLVIIRGGKAESAVQCKFRSDVNGTLSWTDLSTFFGATAAPTSRFKSMIVASNNNGLGKKVKNKGFDVQTISRKDFMALSLEDLRVISAIILADIEKTPPPSSVKTKHSLRDYQLKARDLVLAHFIKEETANIILPCGTGKTLVAIHTAEAYQKTFGRHGTTLICVPSIYLVRQTIFSVRANASMNTEIFVVCSASDVGTDNDSYKLDISEVTGGTGLCVYSTPNELRAALKKSKSKHRLVISTYQSYPKVHKAMGKTLKFDLAICDEAHKTAGIIDSMVKKSGFSLIHDVPSTNKLFMTATRRSFRYDNSDDSHFIAYDMKDESIFGKCVYHLPFRSAMDMGYLTEFKVHLIGIADGEIATAALKKEYQMKAHVESLLNIGMTEGGSRAVIVYTSTVSLAYQMAEATKKAFKNRGKAVFSEGIDGEDNSLTKEDKIRRFTDNFEKGGISFLFNARCLTEGVDIPCVDGIYFSAPKHSIEDIIQAIGRSLRIYPGKLCSSVFLPIFHTEKGTGLISAEKSRFGNMLNIVAAINAIDPSFTPTAVRHGDFTEGGGGWTDEDEDFIILSKKILITGFSPRMRKHLYHEIVDKSERMKALSRRAEEETLLIMSEKRTRKVYQAWGKSISKRKSEIITFEKAWRNWKGQIRDECSNILEKTGFITDEDRERILTEAMARVPQKIPKAEPLAKVA